MAQVHGRRDDGFRTFLIVLIGQVGCLTLAVVTLSIVAGIWLDATFHTRPILTLVFLFGGIPVSVLMMLWVARRTLAKFQAKGQSQETENASIGGPLG